MQRRTFLNFGLTGLGTTLAMANPVPPQFIPNASKEKWAIVFGSWYGTARDASIWISEGMGGIAAVVDIRQIPADLNQNLDAVRKQHPDVFDFRQASVDLSTYDHLIIGTAIHGGKGPKALETYLSKNIDWLQSKIRGLFVVCGNLGKLPGPQQVTTYIDGYLAKLCKTSSVPKRAFGGRITRVLMPEAEYNSIADMYAKFGGPAGDFDILSRSECLKLGNEIYSANA
jgi:menaquinone-dependent protoporphyrinogen IX oxidase